MGQCTPATHQCLQSLAAERTISHVGVSHHDDFSGFSGSVGVGMYGRTATNMAADLITELSQRGGIFFRNASGALMLAYVAAGRLIGYAEAHMNAWDCLAGQLLISEAGGSIEVQSAVDMLENGGRVIVGSPDIYDELLGISETAFKE